MVGKIFPVFFFLLLLIFLFYLLCLLLAALFPHKDLYLRNGEMALTAYATWLPQLDVSCCGITKLPSGRYSSSFFFFVVVLLENPFCESWYIFVDLQATESRDLIGVYLKKVTIFHCSYFYFILFLLHQSNFCSSFEIMSLLFLFIGR